MKTFERMVPALLLAAIIIGWFWPVLLGRQAAGETLVTDELPRATFFAGAIQAGRVPLWNERSGFGAPAVADGRLGVYYPIHQLLYRLVAPPIAYTLSLVLHHLLAGWFAWLCARGFGLSRSAALLTGLAYAGQGFFVAHLDHSWSYTTGCWLPLVVLAAWRWLSDRSAWTWLLVLSAALGVQLLAGHFQLAFFGMVVVLLLGLAAVLLSPGVRREQFGRAAWLPVAIGGGLALAAIQLVPSAELAMLGDRRGRGPEFLESFSTSPLHLVTDHLAPGLLHDHPLWKPISWTPWRSDPSESLTYVGLLPLGLAITILFTTWRDRRVRIIGLVLLATLAFSLGRHLPGSRWLAELPGFGWFSAPARWSVAAGLCWALLAGIGLDRLDPDRLGAWCQRFALVGLLVLVAVVVMLVWDASGAERFGLGPDPSIEPALEAWGYDESDFQERTITPAGELEAMLVRGLALPLLALVGIGLAGMLPLERLDARSLTRAVLVLVAVDLGWTANQLRTVDFVRPPGGIGQSSNLAARMAEPTDRQPAGAPASRVATPLGHWPLIADQTPLVAAVLPDVRVFWDARNQQAASWWSSDWPTLPEPARFGDTATLLARSPSRISPDDVVFMQLAGIRSIWVHAGGDEPDPRGPLTRQAHVTDRWLAERVYGPLRAASDDRLASWNSWGLPESKPWARAWLFPVEIDSVEPGTDPRRFELPPPARRGMLDDAVPVTNIIDDGETITLEGTSDQSGVLVLSDLRYPGWEAELTTGGAAAVPVPIEAAFGHWRAVAIPEIPGGGRWKVVFRFRPQAVTTGRDISLGAVAAWIICLALALLASRFQSLPEQADFDSTA